MLESEIRVEVSPYVATGSASRDEPTAEPDTHDEPEAPEAENGPDASPDEVPENVPDDWLDSKPFDPAGR